MHENTILKAKSDAILGNNQRNTINAYKQPIDGLIDSLSQKNCLIITLCSKFLWKEKKIMRPVEKFKKYVK